MHLAYTAAKGRANEKATAGTVALEEILEQGARSLTEELWFVQCEFLNRVQNWQNERYLGIALAEEPPLLTIPLCWVIREVIVQDRYEGLPDLTQRTPPSNDEREARDAAVTDAELPSERVQSRNRTLTNRKLVLSTLLGKVLQQREFVIEHLNAYVTLLNGVQHLPLCLSHRVTGASRSVAVPLNALFAGLELQERLLLDEGMYDVGIEYW